jgi:cell division transport system permease protein
MNLKSVCDIIKRSWVMQFWINFATTGVLTLSFGIIFGLILFSKNISRLLTIWGDEIQITLYLTDSITETQKTEILQKIKHHPAVASYEYIDKTQAAALFETSLKNYGKNFFNSLKTEVGNPFPAAYHIQLQSQFKNPEHVEEIAKEFQSMTGIEDSSYGREWIKNYTLLLKIGRVLGVLLGLVVFAGCFFAVGNSIRASLSLRREEIEILELIGATNNEVRRPFIIEGAFQGFLASVIALVILSATYTYSYHLLEDIVGLSAITQVMGFFNWIVIINMILFGVWVGSVGSYFCVKNINTGWAAANGVKKL